MDQITLLFLQKQGEAYLWIVSFCPFISSLDVFIPDFFVIFLAIRLHANPNFYPRSSVQGGISGIEKDCDGTVVTSVTNGDACSSGNVSLTLEISLRVERGNEGKWHVLSSMINEVGSVVVKPSGDKKLHSFETMSTNDCGPGFKNVVAVKPSGDDIYTVLKLL
ncbi:hypothetical protein CMV_020551 [Castanea mollissima]|uniref:Uncharacterized protein n=1 Tax=Castanea mollissima TaxID=60419 RepID=A0A8J4QYT2_9ROSI|nr:hypothetical protein CMV_020551 [Castanea mollissima]